MRERKPQWTVGRLSRREQIHFHWAEPLAYQLHHLGVKSLFPGPQPLPRQDVCFPILVPGDIHRSERRQFPLGSQEDLVRQSAQRARPQTPLMVQIRDHWHIVCSYLGHGNRWVLGESSSEPYRPLAFPDNLCAVRNAGPATDLSQSGHP